MSTLGIFRPIMERFWDKIEFDPNAGCWLWSSASRAEPSRSG